jgi:hypothetical protein
MKYAGCVREASTGMWYRVKGTGFCYGGRYLIGNTKCVDR